MIKIGNISTNAGELKWGNLHCGFLANGQAVQIPLFIVHGSKPGPTLFLNGVIHGREIPAIEILRKICREEINPQNLSGTILAVPICNPLAFEAVEHHALQDDKNMNMVRGINPKGSITEKMIHVLLSEILFRSDYLIDMHSNYHLGIEFSVVTPCRNKAVLERSLKLADLFGYPVVELKRSQFGFENSLIAYAQDKGIPACIVEFLGTNIIIKKSVESGILGVKNVLRHLKMIPGPVHVSKDNPAQGIYCYFYNILVENAGILTLDVKPGDLVKKGQTLGVVRDAFGNILENIISPYLAYIRNIPVIHKINSGMSPLVLLVIEPKKNLWK